MKIKKNNTSNLAEKYFKATIFLLANNKKFEAKKFL